MKPDRAGLPCNLQRAMQWPCPIVLFAEGAACAIEEQSALVICSSIVCRR
jgi:hypothetical protein